MYCSECALKFSDVIFIDICLFNFRISLPRGRQGARAGLRRTRGCSARRARWPARAATPASCSAVSAPAPSFPSLLLPPREKNGSNTKQNSKKNL